MYDTVWRAWHGIWYGLAGMAWYMLWSGGHAIVNGTAWWATLDICIGMACYCLVGYSLSGMT